MTTLTTTEKTIQQQTASAEPEVSMEPKKATLSPVEKALAGGSSAPTQRTGEEDATTIGDITGGFAVIGMLIGASLLTAAMVGSDDFNPFATVFWGTILGAGFGALVGVAIGSALFGVGVTLPEEDLPPAPLTPSDRMIFALLGKVGAIENGIARIVIDEQREDADDDMSLAIATAFLAREHAGAITLERIGSQLFAGATDKQCNWPNGSLESGLKGAGQINRLVSEWIGSNSSEPAEDALRRSLSKMETRTLTEKEYRRVLGLFTMVSSYNVVPGRNQYSSIDDPQQLVQQCQQTRPEVYRGLIDESVKAFKDRYEEPAGDD